MSRLGINDYCLRYKQLGKTKKLPLEQIHGLTSDSYIVTNRHGVETTINKQDIIEFDKTYGDVAWDELIQIEQRIQFNTQLLESPTEFGILRGHGIVKKLGTDSICQLDTPWLITKCDHNMVTALAEPRLQQVGQQIVELEEEHEFISNAIDYLC